MTRVNPTAARLVALAAAVNGGTAGAYLQEGKPVFAALFALIALTWAMLVPYVGRIWT